MNRLQKAFGKVVKRVMDRVMGAGLMQEENTPEGERYLNPGMPALIRQAAAESCVLLKNDGTLPLDLRDEVAVFGRCQLDWFYVGYGSGGDVHPAYRRSLMDGLRLADARVNEELAGTYRAWTAGKDNAAEQGWWGHWPYSYPEMPLTDAQVQKAAQSAKTALVVIGRAAGEDRENILTQGSYYLTELERDMLDAVTAAFPKIVVLLNTGSVMDLAWTEEYGDKLSALLLLWQGGMESGCAAADVLYGKTSPSGRLADTIARYYVDYPSAANFGGKEFNAYQEGIFVGYRYFEAKAPDCVLFPFGFGLSYTAFDAQPVGFAHREAGVEVALKITNTGARPGKEVAQLWCHAPAEGLEKPLRVLAAFGKTRELKPGESETLTLSCTEKDFASFDEARRAWVLEAGEYRFEANGREIGSFRLYEAKVLEACEPICVDSDTLRKRILSRLPAATDAVPAEGATLEDVRAGRVSLAAFVAALTLPELEALTRGEGMMNTPFGTPGNAGAFGGVIESLRQKGVRPLITSDGPAGLRLQRFTSLIPCGTALACTWNTALVEALHRKLGEEMGYYGIDVHLAPGMNLHRNPLCGRNFEYYSEDPLLSGKTAAAAVRGVQSTGHASCPKHFACNNQETKRNTNDSRVSERALRELYLRNFEICVKEAQPLTLMTSYNKVNGVWSHYHYDLVTTVLRGEWGWEGTVITDWWMQRAHSPEFPQLRDNAYRVRAGVDVLMPGDMGHTARSYRPDASLLETVGRPDGLTRGELERTARRVLRLELALHPPTADGAD